MNFIIERVDSLDTLDEVTEVNVLAWVRTEDQNVSDMQWALKQLHHVVTRSWRDK